MDTIIKDNVIQPRYYQVAKDRIQSKQAMEPLSISQGRGPVMGYDIPMIVDDHFAISSSSNEALGLNAYQFEKFNTPKLNKLSVDNINGEILNAHITAAGLVSLDPGVLDFPDIYINTGEQESSCTLIAVKATTVQPESGKPLITPPSQLNFTAVKIEGWIENEEQVHAPVILNKSLKQVLFELSKYGFIVNHDTDVFIGLYQFGTTPTMRENYQYYYSYFGNTIPMVPYGYAWPCNTTYNHKTQMSFQELLDKSITGLVTTERLGENCVTDVNIADKAIENRHLKDKILETRNFGDRQILGTHIEKDTIETLNMKDGIVTTDKLAEDALDYQNVHNSPLGPGNMISLKITEVGTSSNEGPTIDILYPFNKTLADLDVNIDIVMNPIDDSETPSVGEVNDPVARGIITITTKPSITYLRRMALMSFNVYPDNTLPNPTAPPPSTAATIIAEQNTTIINFQIISTGMGTRTNPLPWSALVQVFVENYNRDLKPTGGGGSVSPSPMP